MVRRNVQIPMYQARIPIRGGGGRGGNIDLTERPETNPIVGALEQIIQRKRQREQDELARRMTEARIGQMQQPEQTRGQIVVSDGTTWLVNPMTGEKKDLGIPAPKGKASNDLINAWIKLGQYEERSPEEERVKNILGREILSEYPRINPITGQPQRRFSREGEMLGTVTEAGTLKPREGTRRVVRKKVKSKEVKGKPAQAKAAKRPPKPKEYPDAAWSEEHKMWTVVRNGRLKGIQ